MKGAINSILLFFLILAILAALCLVAIQIAFVVTVNGSLATWARSILQTPVCILCSFPALIAFTMSYLSKPTKEN